MNAIKHLRMSEILISHCRDFVTILGDLYRSPGSSFLTIAVIGLALSLPLAFLVILNNIGQFSNASHDTQAQMTVFLKSDVFSDKRMMLEKKFKENPAIIKVQVISPETALQELNESLNRQDQGSNGVTTLPNNPLPWSFVLALDPNHPQILGKNGAESLLKEIQSLPEVEIANLDLQWLQRFMSGIQFAKQLVTGISILLAFAVLFVIGNTLRLNIENQKENIEILKLVGATHHFIRRPFLYLGIWYGGLGAILALGVVAVLGLWINRSASDFFALYHHSFQWLNPDVNTLVTLVLLGILLGFGGAWLAVSRYLHSLEVHE